MRKDKQDVSKIEEIEENRQATTATNVVYQGKEDHFEVAQKLDQVVAPKEKAWLSILTLYPLSWVSIYVYVNLNFNLMCLM